VAGVERGIARLHRLVAVALPAAFGTEILTESPGSTTRTGSRSREK
jgi:hypothetical protein